MGKKKLNMIAKDCNVHITMPTIVQVDGDKVRQASDGRGIAYIYPHQVSYRSEHWRQTIVTQYRDHFAYIVEGTILVTTSTFLGVVYETEKGNDMIQVKFWPIDFDMIPFRDLKALFMLLFGYTFKDMADVQELCADVEVAPEYSCQITQNWHDGLRVEPAVVKRYELGVMRVDIEPRERPCLKHIPDRVTPVIDCEHILSGALEECLLN